MEETQKKMDGAIANLSHEFAGLRTGRASAAILDPIMVDAYGSPVPINQVGSVSVPEPSVITVNVWDKSLVRAVEKAITDSDLGLNPMAEGQLVRIPIPQLSEERRIEITKIAAKYAENAKISIRNIRRDAIDVIKKQEKNKEISEDEMHNKIDDIQQVTDEHTAKVDDLLKKKKEDIMSV